MTATRSRKHHTPPTDEERTARRDRERELVRASVEAFRNGDGWQNWLRSRSRFRNYSFHNQMLIAHQHPTATRVASFKAWLELGYCVRKRPDDVPAGEYGIRIWAPCRPSKQQVEEARAKDEPEPGVRFFRLVSVFAQDQVDPLPEFTGERASIEPPVVPVEGDDLAPCVRPLTALATEHRCSVSFEPTGTSATGYLDTRAWQIVVDPAGSVNQQVKTLIHEIAHLLVRRDRHDDDPELTHADEELVAESVAMSACTALGIDTSGYSVPYLTSWSEREGTEALERGAALIDRLARRIEDQTEGTMA